MRKPLLAWVFLFFLSLTAHSQKMDFLPANNLWSTQTLDPLAAQAYGQIAKAWEGNVAADYAITGFEFGFQKSFFGWNFSNGKAFEIGLEAGAFTQFEWTTRTGDFQRNILSTDFKIGMPMVLVVRQWSLRFRVYHLSAHMGDDYMIRNKIKSYVNNNNNYEQFDITAAYQLDHIRFYGGIGVVVRAAQYRAPMVFTAGTEYLLPLNEKQSTQFFAGFHVDSQQDFEYRPGVNVGAGVQLGKPGRRPVKILATYFNGPLPYSVYTGNHVQWLGAAFYMNPF